MSVIGVQSIRFIIHYNYTTKLSAWKIFGRWEGGENVVEMHQTPKLCPDGHGFDIQQVVRVARSLLILDI